MTREFQIQPGVREKVPLFVGLVGPSGSGKTFSALRLATGMKKAHGGPIIFIDTENRRALHYATDFDFMHLEFGAPYGSLDYLAAINQAADLNPSAIIIDSMSHEHEGPGGLLEAHERELDRMVPPGQPDWKRDSMGFAAWQKPKTDRRALLQGLTRTNANVIACFRAQEKTKPVKNDKGKMVPTIIGWSAITDQTFVYEMTMCALLLPSAKGVPTWETDMPAERAAMKRPGQFEDIIRNGEALCEDHGYQLARWAAGGAEPKPPQARDIDALKAEGSHAAALGTSFLQAFWKRLTKAEQATLKPTLDEAWKPAAAKADAKVSEPEDDGFELTNEGEQ